MKTCNKCKEDLDESMFSSSGRRRKDGSQILRPKCKPCQAKVDALYYDKNQDTIKNRTKVYESKYSHGRRLRRYGLTEEQYNAMLERFDGKCSLCKEKAGTHIDHNHKCCEKVPACGQCVRGILCSRCNVGLGYFLDSPLRLQQAQEYLTTNPDD